MFHVASVNHFILFMQVQEDLEADQLVMLRHVKTRWLQLQLCLQRVLGQWNVITTLFEKTSKKPTDRVVRIKSQLTEETKNAFSSLRP